MTKFILTLILAGALHVGAQVPPGAAAAKDAKGGGAADTGKKVVAPVTPATALTPLVPSAPLAPATPGTPASPPSCATNCAIAPEEIWWVVFWSVAGTMFVGILFLMAPLMRAKKSEWSSVEMFSEPGGTRKASASRIIALFGLLVNSCVILGLGLAGMWRLLHGLPLSFDGAGTIVGSAATLFAPYVANQVKQILPGSGPAAPLAQAGTPGVGAAQGQAQSLFPAAPVSPLGGG